MFFSAQARPEIAALLKNEKAVAVGVSGGPDSMALCHMLCAFVRDAGGGAEIHALSVDHGLRPEAADEAAQVGARVRGWPGVRHEVLRWQGVKPETGIMEEARAARYDLMCDYCKKIDIKHIFLAHHLDDQAETFLIRLAKGSGIEGLCGMQMMQVLRDGIMLVRPLLDVPKADLVLYCEKMGVPSILDPSNANPAYLRPRLRAAKDVLGREGLTPERLARTAMRLARARSALEEMAQRAHNDACIAHDNGSITFDGAVLEQWPEEIRLRVIRKASCDLIADRDGYGPRMERLEEIVTALFSSETVPRCSLGGVLFSRRKGGVILEREGAGEKKIPEKF